MKRGLDLPFAGEPAQIVEDAAACSKVGVLGADVIGLKPTLRVQPGDRVRRGQCLFEDKANPGVRFTSPGAGVVSAVHRGERRVLQSVVIDLDDDDAADAQVPLNSYRGAAPEALSAEDVRALLLESGLWTALRTRPFSRVASPDAVPRALFITAIDTRPHAPSVAVVLADRQDDFAIGVACLAKLTSGPVHLCLPPGLQLPLPSLPQIKTEVFHGPHPAGNVGTHIHLLSPVDHERRVWHIGYQDVIAVGALVRTGRLDLQRVVSLAGPGVQRPRLLRTRQGAELDSLTRGQIAPGLQRVVSGSVLDGCAAAGPVHGWLGRYHLQVSVLPEAVEREFLGWMLPGWEKYSIWGVVVGAFGRRKLALNTTTNGGQRAMVPIGAFERVMPLDLMPTFLLRALLMGQDERAEKLGALELDEEDLALCTFVCPGKAEYGPLLRQALTRIEKENT